MEKTDCVNPGKLAQTAPDFLFIDTITFAYRMGHMRHEEVKAALLAAARAATDAITFMRALENFGVGRRSKLHAFCGEVLAAPAFYRAKYPIMLGLRQDGAPPEAFLKSQHVLFLAEPFLTKKQQGLLFDTYWWFVNQHSKTLFNPKTKTLSIGIYASEPTDNASVLARFEDCLLRLKTHKTTRIRASFEDFPADIIVAVHRRAFL